MTTTDGAEGAGGSPLQRKHRRRTSAAHSIHCSTQCQRPSACRCQMCARTHVEQNDAAGAKDWSGRAAHSTTSQRSKSVCSAVIAAPMVAHPSRLSPPAASACDVHAPLRRLLVVGKCTAGWSGAAPSGGQRPEAEREKGAAHCCPVHAAAHPAARRWRDRSSSLVRAPVVPCCCVCCLCSNRRGVCGWSGCADGAAKGKGKAEPRRSTRPTHETGFDSRTKKTEHKQSKKMNGGV